MRILIECVKQSWHNCSRVQDKTDVFESLIIRLFANFRVLRSKPFRIRISNNENIAGRAVNYNRWRKMVVENGIPSSKWTAMARFKWKAIY